MHTNQSDLRVRMMALAIAGFVSGASVRVAEPLLPTLAEHFDVPVAEAAQIIGGFALAYGLFQLVHGPLGDRLGKLPMVGLMAVLASAMCFASAYADTLNGLIALRVATGATAGAIIPLSFSFVGDNVQFADRQRVLARFISGILMGQILGPALGGIVSEWLGWQAVFTLLGAGFLTVGVALLSLAVGGAPEPRASVGVSVLATYRALLSSPTVRVVCAVVAVEGFFFHGALGFVGAYLREAFEFGDTAIGLSLAGFGVGGCLYSLTVGILLARLGPPRMVLVAGVVLLAGFGALGLAPVGGAVAAWLVVLGFGFYMLHNTLQTRATEMAPEARGAAVSLFAFMMFSGQGAGIAVAGFGVDGGFYAELFMVSGLGLCILSVLFGRWLRSTAGQLRD